MKKDYKLISNTELVQEIVDALNAIAEAVKANNEKLDEIKYLIERK